MPCAAHDDPGTCIAWRDAAGLTIFDDRIIPFDFTKKPFPDANKPPPFLPQRVARLCRCVYMLIARGHCSSPAYRSRMADENRYFKSMK